jgi:hypothetical protein
MECLKNNNSLDHLPLLDSILPHLLIAIKLIKIIQMTIRITKINNNSNQDRLINNNFHIKQEEVIKELILLSQGALLIKDFSHILNLKQLLTLVVHQVIFNKTYLHLVVLLKVVHGLFRMVVISNLKVDLVEVDIKTTISEVDS